MQKLERNVRKLAPLGAALLLSAFGATAAMAQDAAAPAAPAGPTAMSTPAMSGPLAANPDPFSFDTSDWLGDAGGKIYVGGAVSGLAYYQTSPTRGAAGDATCSNNSYFQGVLHLECMRFLHLSREPLEITVTSWSGWSIGLT